MDPTPDPTLARLPLPGTGRTLPLDHNPALAPWQAHVPHEGGGKGSIEVPGQALNLIWQTRPAAPTPYENALADALEQVFGAGAQTPQQIVDGFAGMGFRTHDGQAWTVERFEAEMARLGA